jgi:formylglycine-generating enzyme required for sulfatase activity
MPRPANPYIAGNPVGNSPAFVGRDDVLQKVLGVLGDEQHHGVVLYGQRRIGKTSILHHLAEWLPKNGGPRAIYFDLQDKAAWPVGKIMAQLATTIAKELGLPPPVAGPEPEVWFRETWLPPVLAGLPEGASLAVLFDEFDVLADAESKKAASEAFFGYLRALLSETAPRLRLVFVIGRTPEELTYLAGPLFKSMSSTHVSLLPREAAEALVRMSEAKGGLRWSDEAVEAAWGLTSGQPYLLQHLCWQVFQRAYAKGEPKAAASAADVEAAVPSTLDASRNALEWLWGGLPPAGRVVASGLAKAGHGVISRDALDRVLRQSGVQVMIRDLETAPKLLEQWDLLESVGDGHRFRVELLRRWIAQFKPLSQVQDELDKINPLADVLYQAGERFYRDGKVDEAALPLRQALGVNPSHVKAREMLAEILIAKRAWDEALGVLEDYPDVTRPRLVQVLVEKARAATVEEERLGWYERALALDAHAPAALEGKRAIWKDRGDRARASGSFDEAVKAYREAGRADLAEEATNELRTIGLDRVRVKVAELEEVEQYEAALDAIRKTGDTYAGITDWAQDVERLKRAAQRRADYQRASGALKAGDRETAMRLLAGVVATDPKYKDAARLLYDAVSDNEVERREQTERKARERAEATAQAERREREKAQATTEAERKARVDAESMVQVAQTEAVAGVKRAEQGRVRVMALAMVEGMVAAALGGWILFKMPHASIPPSGTPTASVTTAPPIVPPAPASSFVSTPDPPPAVCPPEMAFIQGGSYKMGSDEYPDEKPPHDVTVAAFCMDMTEVTVKAYAACAGCKPAGTQHPWCNGTKADRQDYPVNCVTWEQARDYCKAQQKRLPSEEEWEYAARGGKTQHKYPWGDTPPGAQLCWDGEGSDLGKGKRTSTCPVGKYPDGDAVWGTARLHDMAGNVWEWTSSYYCNYDTSKPCTRDQYVIRGGGWFNVVAALVRAAFRLRDAPSDSDGTVGFRCARTPQ